MTRYTIENAPFTWRHAWIVFVASLGQLLGTAIATIVSVMIPLIQILGHPELASWEQGLLGAMDLIGITVGATVLGRLSNRWGYLRFFRLCPAVVLLSSLACLFFPDIWVLYAALFVIGFAIGGEYSLDSDYVSELMPLKWRSTMVGVTKTASAFGNILVAGIAFLMVSHWTYAGCWPRLMWMMVAASALMVVCRIWFAGSPKWLLEHGRLKEAERSVAYFLGPEVGLSPQDMAEATSRAAAPKAKQPSMLSFLRSNGKRVVLTGIPWACEGLGVYGIGIFLPVLVLALGIAHQDLSASAIMHVASSVEITFWISCLILPGFLIGLWMIRRRVSPVRQMAWGFYVCAACMVALGLAFSLKWAAWISITAFMLFELFLNLGPHLITYVLPPEVYPVEVRSMGSGLAASLGKVGAVLAVFFIPVLLKAGGVVLVLGVSAAVMLVGGLVTSIYGQMVMGK